MSPPMAERSTTPTGEEGLASAKPRLLIVEDELIVAAGRDGARAGLEGLRNRHHPGGRHRGRIAAEAGCHPDGLSAR